MKRIAIFFTVVACLVWPPTVLRAETPNTDVETIGPAKSEDAENTLNRLFEKLGRETKASRAGATARQIWNEWTQSGSSSIDLLMNWAARAMAEKNHAAAQDLLDQVIVLAPDYAEGWNRRATLYYTMSDFGRSIADIKQTLELEPRHFGALAGLAAILQRLDREEEALQTWYRVLEIYPANKPAQDAVVSLEEKLSGSRI